MPNNFKLRGDYYVSKAGNDSNDGLTPDTPKRTIQAGLNLSTNSTSTLIIGEGVYNESISKVSNTPNIKGDGIVILDGTGNKTFIILQAYGALGGPNGAIIQDIIIRNYTSFNLGSLYFGTSWTISSFSGATPFLKIGSIIGLGSISPVHSVYNSIFINCTINPSSNFHRVYSSVIINCFLKLSGGGLQDSYVSPSSVIDIGSSVSINNYNNIQGSIIVGSASVVTTGIYQDIYGRYYDLSIATSTGDGSIGNPYGRPYTNGAGFNFSTHRILYPASNANSFSSDPGFNNILKQDFSLQSSSFMVGRASDFVSNIGGTYVATRLNASGSTFSGSNATVDNLVFSSFSDYVISGSAMTGSVTSAPIFISSSAKVIQEIDYNGLLAFNKDTTAPTGSNVNVPDVLTYTSASNQPGANPDRLTYYMRWTTGSSQPVSDAQWENGGLWPAGSFNTFEWNTKPSVDFLGRGNGDQNFNIVNTPTYVKATWIQLRLSLRNNYLI